MLVKLLISVMFCLGDGQRSFISGYNALLSSPTSGSESCKYIVADVHPAVVI